ncbi:GntR family transcriptional regulator [Pectobacteriaceae bacterium CE90]|nr:GntR family transcriptional regulator [Prodigiosinella sp. LS101]WJV54324.1 GntR family transcriptional regulator [Prodigiosinella sp. LS101]WJY14659.1 GntR family transcriptional regulator [Pectobacteriaceae bacterium CE90]
MQALLTKVRGILEQPSSAPRYMQLAAALELCIGQYNNLSGQFLPPERQIVQSLGLSRVTVSRSLALLEEKGLIVRQQGVGTRITQQLDYALNKEDVGFTAQIQQRGGIAGNIWLERTQLPIPSALIAEMKLSAGAMVTKLRRVRLLNDEPISLETVWIPQEWLPHPEEVELSLYQYWADRNIFPQNKRYRLRAVSCMPEIAEHLGVLAGTPLLLSRQHTYNAHGDLLEYCEIYCRSDIYEFQVSE